LNAGQGGSTTLQPLRLLQVLREHDVEFLVIGGVAVAAHGFVRGTKDVDIIPEPSSANLDQLLVALDD